MAHKARLPWWEVVELQDDMPEMVKFRHAWTETATANVWLCSSTVLHLWGHSAVCSQ